MFLIENESTIHQKCQVEITECKLDYGLLQLSRKKVCVDIIKKLWVDLKPNTTSKNATFQVIRQAADMIVGY
jgi:hypothetical protein